MRTQAIVRRGLTFALIWWVLAQGRTDSWGVGMVSIALAVAASLHLLPPERSRLSITGLLGFAGFFLVHSVKGGIQVAAMALRPKLDLAPLMLDLPLTLPPGLARVILVNTLNLLPGTVTVRIDQATLRLHVLDQRRPIAKEVREVEARIARMLGIAP
ncbi:MAG: Na+/H+ antiporter subunit E [Polaromonas sp.]|uniref:Na+/H+ antiporter subunit E n=1 Tax=Polaromonas sp. TaxID=1869339 RepID=UPI0027300D07|nr:Na+/H+ antiporter subunit E [Polaromonas sp.]MDP2256721.1 Na+/H+ antiporter subunit E [Polaromonas sp.]